MSFPPQIKGDCLACKKPVIWGEHDYIHLNSGRYIHNDCIPEANTNVE